MRKQGHIKRLLCVGLLFAALLPSCSLIHDDELDCQLYTEEGVPYAYVSIALNTSAATPSTRAGNPTGGEDGDGEEPGQSYENEVEDITLFFYEATDGVTGVNAAGTTPIVARLSLSENDFTYTQGNDWASTNSIEVEQLLVNHSYHVLAVVNGGDSYGENFKTLGDLQKATVTTLYTTTETEDKVTYSHFLMSSEKDENPPLHIYANNSATNPALTTIRVERVTARVDYRIDPSKTDKDGAYVIENIGTAKITGAMLVNTLNDDATSYLLKRVTTEKAEINTTPTWLGDETYMTETGAATNYVIAPFTTTLTADNASTYFSTANYFPSFDYDNADEWEKLFITGTEITDSDETWLRIGYPKENTAEKADLHYTTGVVFQADFLPTDYEEDATFFEWNGKIYPTVEAAMQAFDSKGWGRIDETKDQWASVTKWDELRNNIIAGLQTGDPAGYKLFLEKQAEGKDGTSLITAEEKAKLRWSNYMETHCHYKLENNEVRVDIDGESTRSALAPFGLATYYQGICYYTYWIKHANDQITDNDMPFAGGGVMEYGIVRNNIYKLNVTGITQLGNDIPGDRTLLINVSVRNWELIEGEKEIELQPTTGNE